MSSGSSIPSTPLILRDLVFPALHAPPVNVELRPGATVALILPEDELHATESLLSGTPAEMSGTARLCGVDPAEEGAWSGPLAGRVARTFSPLFGGGCWLENLDVDENILLASLMRGERPSAARSRAEALARQLGIDSLPDGRRSGTPSSTLTVCQWVRAFMMEQADLFLMIDSLRKAPPDALRPLGGLLRARREKGAAVFWLLPSLDPDQAALLDVDTVIEPAIIPRTARHS